VPTDKKFTGQRLDNTGLYYYGARYYDASIGRFISPDTIISNPANPQSYNRYSYCLNNPLKYRDPSGHRIDFYDPVLDLLNDFNQYGLGFILPSHVFRNLIALYNAWTTYSEAAPDAATRLESVDELITIKWASLERAEGDFNPVGDGNYEILLDNELIDKDPRRAVVSLAHESFHVLTRMDNPGLGVTRYEETIAWSYGYWVGEERGYEHATASLFRDITPHVPGTGYLPITEFEERVVRGIRLFEALKWYEGMTPGSRTNLKQLQITAFTYWPW
jgi:RHS repeat-associated protein